MGQDGKRLVNKNALFITAVIITNILLAGVSVLKDSALALFFGTTRYGDLLYFAYFLPDAIGWNIIGQTVSVSLVPAFTRLYKSGRHRETRRLGVIAFITVISFTALLCIILISVSRWIAAAYGNSITADENGILVRLMLILFPVVIVVPASSVATAFLNARKKFIPAAAAPVIFNATILAGVILSMVCKLDKLNGAYAISVSFLMGTILMLALLAAFSLRKAPDEMDDSNCSGFDELIELLKHTFKTMLPYIIILLGGQAVLFAERLLATGMSSGSVSALTYAYRLVQFPVWVFVAAVSAVMLPDITASGKWNADGRLIRKINRFLLTTTIIVIPMAIMIGLFRFPLISFLFERGAFDSASRNLTAGIIPGYALSIVFQSLSLVLQRVYIAAGRMKRISIVYIAAFCINILFDILVSAKTGIAALGWGASAGWLIIFIMTVILMKQSMGINLIAGKYVKKYINVIILNIVLLLLTIIVVNLFGHFFCYDLLTSRKILYIFPLGAFFAAAYCFSLYKLGLANDILREDCYE